MRWNQGRLQVERMLEHHELVRTTPDPEQAHDLVARAQHKLIDVPDVAALDPRLAYQLDYTAAAMAFRAVLANQGLATADPADDGTVYGVVRAQLAPPLGQLLKPFSLMWRRLEQPEPPRGEEPVPITGDEALKELDRAAAIVDVSGRVLGQMDPF